MDIQKQCKGCIYFRPIAGTGNANCTRCCHYYLDTLRRRVEKDGKCLSRMTEEMIQEELKKKKVKKK